MAWAIFEIFDCADGKTQGLRHTAAKALETIERCERYGHALLDYAPVEREGFYVVDMRDYVKAGPFETREAARARSTMENMASDANSFHVVEHKL